MTLQQLRSNAGKLLRGGVPPAGPGKTPLYFFIFCGTVYRRTGK